MTTIMVIDNNTSNIINTIINKINRNPDYINFYKCTEINDNTIIFQILDYSNLEYLYYNFIKKIYYTLCDKSIISLIINNPDFTKVQIEKNINEIIIKNNDVIELKINIKIF